MKVLLVRLSSMGDLIHTLPALTDLARFRPDVQLDWLCEQSFADIAQLHPFMRHVWTMRWRFWRKNLFQAATWHEMRCLKNNLQSEKYDLVLDSQGLLKSAFFAKWSNAPVYGLDKYSAREAWAARFYAKKFAVKKGEDAIWRNRQLFAQVFDYSFEHTPDFGVNISGSLNDLPENYHVVLHATSRDSKLWQFNNWLNLLNKIHEVDNLPIILPWGNPTEYNRAQNIAAQLDFAVVGPKLTLFQAAQLLANAKSVIGVDTGLLHLANAVNRPLVGIYTDSDPMKTGVQPSDWAVNLGGIGQMPSVEDVFAAQQKCIQNFQAA